MKYGLALLVMTSLFFNECSRIQTTFLIENMEEQPVERIYILEQNAEDRGNVFIHTPIFPLQKDDSTYIYTYKSGKNRRLILTGEYDDGSKSRPQYHSAIKNDSVHITFKNNKETTVHGVDSSNSIRLEAYKNFQAITPGKPFKLRILSAEDNPFMQGKSYKVKLEGHELLTPYVTVESDSSLLAEFTIPFEADIVGKQKLFVYDPEDHIIGFSNLLITSSEKPQVWIQQNNSSENLFTDDKFHWIGLEGKNLIGLSGRPIILDSNAEIDDYIVSSDTEIKLRIRTTGSKPMETLRMQIPYLYSTGFNQAEKRYQYTNVELCTNHIIRQYVEIRGDIAANITGEDSSSNTSGSGGMVWNYRWPNGRQCRIGAFYSLSKTDTLTGGRPQIFGSSIFNPFLGEGASIKLEGLNIWVLKWLFEERVIGFYAFGTFNKVIWKGQRPVLNNAGDWTDSTFLDVQDGQVFIFGAGFNFTPIEQKVVAGNNIATLKFEAGICMRDMEGDLGLKRNREFYSYLLNIDYNPKKGLRTWGLEFGSKIRFNQIFVDIRYSYFPPRWSPVGDVLGLSGSRVAVRVGIEGNILKVNLN